MQPLSIISALTFERCLLYSACHAKFIFADHLQTSRPAIDCHRFWNYCKTPTIRLYAGAESIAPATKNDTEASKSGANMLCLYHFVFEMCFASQPRALFEQLNVQECSEPEVFSTSDFETHFAPQPRALFYNRSNLQKWSENEVFLTLLRVQLRALSRQLNVQKCSEPCVFLTFWLGNALRATAACIFSTGSKVLRTCCAFNILTWQCASPHGHVHFLIFLPTRWLSAHRFSKPTFRPSGNTKQWKNTAFRDSTFQPLRARWPSCYWLSLLWLFPPPVAASAHIWEAWFLNFLRPSFDPAQWTLTNTATRKSWWKRGSSDSLAAATTM